MSRLRVVLIAAAVSLTVALAWALFIGLPQWVARSSVPASAPAGVVPSEPERKIQARLFYVSDDGRALTGIEQDVAYGADAGMQARAILEAQVAPPGGALVSAIPAGTRVRAVFVANGEAYVDLTPEVVTAHPGGSLNEQLTVHTLVHAVTTNLPAVARVQILVDGKEVDTLAGHVDLRQPLARDAEWVR